MIKLYNLLEGKNIILSSAPAQAIREYLGKPNAKLSDYVKHGRLAAGKYRIIPAGEVRANERIRTNGGFTIGDCERWEAVCERFRGFEWTSDPKEATHRLGWKEVTH